MCPVFIRLQYHRRPWGGSVASCFFKLLYCSTGSVAIRATNHKPGLHAVCGKYHSVTDCNLFSNAEYEKSQIKLRVWGLMVIHLVEKTSLWNKTAPPELSLCHCFFVFVSAGGGGRVYRWVPGRRWVEDSAETLKNNTKHIQFLYLSGFTVCGWSSLFYFPAACLLIFYSVDIQHSGLII